MKTEFKNIFFYWLLVGLIGFMLIWNIISLIFQFNLLTFLPITIQIFLLYLILSKNKYAKIGIKIWTILFVITAFGLQFLGKTLKIFADGFIAFNPAEYFRVLFFLIIGILILVFTVKTVVVK